MLTAMLRGMPLLVVLFVDGQSFFIQTIYSNFGNVCNFIIFKLIDISNNFAFIGTNFCEQKKVLEGFIIAQ